VKTFKHRTLHFK